MGLMHTLHHLKRDRELVILNKGLAQGVRDLDLAYELDGFLFTHAEPSMLKELEDLHHKLYGAALVPWIGKLYKSCAEELVSVILNKEGRIAGYEMFIFNEGEYKARLIHSAFLGIAYKHQGQGLSTKLRQYSIKCYDKNQLAGISTVAAVDNIKAIRAAQKAGFVIQKASVKPPGYYMVTMLMSRS